MTNEKTVNEISIEDRQAIKILIQQALVQHKTLAKVATLCRVSTGTLSQILSDTYVTKGDDMLIKIGTALGWKPIESAATGWKFIETTDFKTVERILLDAKSESLFMCISDIAGIGKTVSLKYYASKYAAQAVYYLQCKDWGIKEFLQNLCRILGLDACRTCRTPGQLLTTITDFFNMRSTQKPLLVIDEADKLKASAILSLIPIYNDCEDVLGCVIAGTDFLEKEIKTGVRYKSKGFDEIDSRFGRRYLKMLGCTLNEVVKICEANGITDSQKAKTYFEECKPTRAMIDINNQKREIRTIKDLRRLKRLIKKEQLKATIN